MVELPEMKEHTGSKFRFNASKVFLTYSDLPKGLTPQRLKTKIESKAGVKRYLISQEKHKNGRNHLHALIEFKKKLDTKNVKFFDVEFYGLRHPNIQKPRDFFKTARYIKKDNSYITNYPNDAEPLWMTVLAIPSDIEFHIEYLWASGGKMDSYTTFTIMQKLRSLRRSKARILTVAEQEQYR